MSASNEQATTRGRNHAGRLVFFRGPKGFGGVFFFLGDFLGAVAACVEVGLFAEACTGPVGEGPVGEGPVGEGPVGEGPLGKGLGKAPGKTFGKAFESDEGVVWDFTGCAIVDGSTGSAGSTKGAGLVSGDGFA
jgi:hypothetical protein